MLAVQGLTAKIASTGQQILNGVNLTVREGEVHAVMGKNGSGKSTLSKVLVGHPDYVVTGGSALFKGKSLFEMEPEERSHAGLFLSFQSPIEIPGVSNIDFLRMAANSRRKARGEAELDPLEFYAYVMPKARRAAALQLHASNGDVALFPLQLEMLNMDPAFLNRNVNEGFSGGEKKRNEILQLAVLEVGSLASRYSRPNSCCQFQTPTISLHTTQSDMSILDEIDSGLDIDALRDVAKAVNALRTKESGVLMITHYKVT
jgi:Fe-S cluster assembly ATP-binding protein